jgi:hypothetical protein
MVSLTRHVFDSWKQMSLPLLDTELLAKETKRLRKLVSRTVQPKKLISHWPVFKGLDADVKNLATVRHRCYVGVLDMRNCRFLFFACLCIILSI